MRKHIKLKGKLIKSNKAVEITLLEMSHFGNHFGNEERGAVFRGSYKLHSFMDTGLELVQNDALFFPDKRTPKNIPSSCTVDLDTYKKIKETVIAYNNFEFPD